GALTNKDIIGDINEENMVVIPNSVDVERFIKKQEEIKKLREINRTNFHLKDDELVIGHIGRLENVKNHELTIKLAEYIKEKNLRMKILIIGVGNREAELKKIVNQKKLDSIITFRSEEHTSEVQS